MVLCIGLLAGCSDTASEPVAGTLQVALTSPFTDDGALLFTITGGRIDSVEAAGLTIYTSRPDASTLEVILLGNVGSGTIARLNIPDERLASQYSATLSQAAARGTYAQRDPAGYHLDLAP
jgi:hypothetical protein